MKKLKKDLGLEVKAESQKEQMIAKKDFKIVHNNYVRDVKVGDDLSDIPLMYVSNLKAENVI